MASISDITKSKLFADIVSSQIDSTSELFVSSRPDIAIVDANQVSTLELTVCHELNIHNSKQYKLSKYKDIANQCTAICARKRISNFSLVVSTLGLISSTLDFSSSLGLPPMPSSLKERLITSVLDNLFKIYCNRNTA